MPTHLQATLLFFASVCVGIAAYAIEFDGDAQLAVSAALFMTLVGLFTTLLWWGVSRPHRDDPDQRFRLTSPLQIAGCYVLLSALGVATMIAGGFLDPASAVDDGKLLGWIGVCITGHWQILNATQRRQAS